MAIAYQSVQSNSSTDTALVITKPVDLAVGDTMLAGISFSDDGSSAGGINTPSGWTLLSTTNTGTPTGEVLAIFIKEADSGDVSASNFTFTRSGEDSTYHLIGHILRITDFGILAGSSSNISLNSGTTLTLTGFTPTRADTLFVGFLLNSGSSAVNNVSVALATDNPSWTERADTEFDDGTRDSRLGVYTATRSAITATGNITATYAGSVPVRHAYVVSLSSQTNGTVSPVTYANAYAYNPIDTDTYAEAYVTDPTPKTRKSRNQWTSPTKESSTWNEPNL